MSLRNKTLNRHRNLCGATLILWLRVHYTTENHCPTIYVSQSDNRTNNTAPLNTVKSILKATTPGHTGISAPSNTIHQCCFIAICICIKPSQTHGSVSGWSSLPVIAWDTKLTLHAMTSRGDHPDTGPVTIGLWWFNAIAYSNETAMNGRVLISLLGPSVVTLRCIASIIDHSCKGHDLRWVFWYIQHQEVHRLGSSA